MRESKDFYEEFVKCRLEIIQEENTIAEERAVGAVKETNESKLKKNRKRENLN